MAERVFAKKLEKAGFTDFRFSGRRAYSIDDCALFPLFTPELLALMRRVIPPERQSCVATSVVVQARRP
jgi:arsenite methyltransferase